MTDTENKLKFDGGNPKAYFKNLQRLSRLNKWDEEKTILMAIFHIGLNVEWLGNC